MPSAFAWAWEVFGQGCLAICGMGDIGRDLLDSFVLAQSLAATFRELFQEFQPRALAWSTHMRFTGAGELLGLRA